MLRVVMATFLVLALLLGSALAQNSCEDVGPNVSDCSTPDTVICCMANFQCCPDNLCVLGDCPTNDEAQLVKGMALQYLE